MTPYFCVHQINLYLFQVDLCLVTPCNSYDYQKQYYVGPGEARATVFISYLQVSPYLRPMPQHQLASQDTTHKTGAGGGTAGHYTSLRPVDMEEKVHPSFPSPASI